MNPNAALQTPGTMAGTGTASTPPTIAINGLSTPQTPVQLPPPPAPTNPIAVNSSIPTPSSIIQQETTPTSTDTAQTDILGRIAALTRDNSSLATLQTNTEANAGVPHLTKSVNDLSVQLQGLNDHATALSLAGGAGGTIQNTNENAAIGRMSTGGMQGQEAIDLRNNQIQQAAVAAQALTVKSALYGAQGNLTLAKDSADKAAQVQYDGQQQQVAYQQAQLAAIQPQLNKEQKAKADLVSAQLADRQTAITNARTDMSTGIAMATAAMKNNPNDPVAQYAAQQALQAAQQQPPDLNKIFGLVGKYQVDPNATQKSILELQALRANIAQSNASAAKTRVETAALQNPANPSTGMVIGATGASTVDATTPGYATAAIGGAGGRTQAAIDQAAIVYASTGKLPTGIGMGSTGAAGQFKTAIENRAGELNAGGNMTANASQLKALTSSLSQQTQYLNTVQRSVSNAEAGYQQVISTFQSKGINQSQLPIANLISNAAKYQLAPGDISAFRAGLTEVANEYTQVFSRGGQATDAVRSKAASIADGNLSINDLGKVFTELQAQGHIVLNGSQTQVQQIQDQINGIVKGASTNTGSTTMTGPDGKQYNVPNTQVSAFIKAGGKK